MASTDHAEKSSEWMDRYRLKFLGSVQVPFHKGNDVLCAAMQKVKQPRPCLSLVRMREANILEMTC